MPSHERFLGRLNGLKQLPDSGAYLARWEARCPAHNDRSPSLSISLAPEGHLLVHCHAGCDTKAVMSAVGLEMGDLFPPSSPSPAPSTPASSKKAAPEKSASAKPPSTPNKPLSRPTTKTGRSGRLTAAYDYYDAQGTLLYQVVRFDPKGFRQRRPNPKGGWTWSVKGIERVPYFLPEMLEAIGEGHPIVIVEGEKDAETALQMRSALDASSGRLFSATTAPGGAGKWPSSFSRYFKGAHVWVVPDVDEAGFEHARQVAGRLRGVAETIKVLRLPSTEEHFDLSDWAAQGKTAADLLRLADQSPSLLSRAHPTHEVDFEAVPGPSASLDEIREYLTSAGSVRSGKMSGDASAEELAAENAPPENTPTASTPAENTRMEEAPTGDVSTRDVSTGKASSEKGSALSPPEQEDKQPASTAPPPEWKGLGARRSDSAGIGVVASDGHASTETILSGLDRIEHKSRNGAVGFSLPPPPSKASDPSGPDPSDSDPSDSEGSGASASRSNVSGSGSRADERRVHAGGADPLGADVPSGIPSEEAAKKPPSRKTRTSEKGACATTSRQNGTSHSSNTGLSESRPSSASSPSSEPSVSSEPSFSSDSNFSSETRAVIHLLEEEGAEVMSAGGAFYLVFPFLSSRESAPQKHAGEQKQDGGRPSFSGKAYPLESPLVVPLLLRLAHNRKGWIPSPNACRAALLFLTPAVPASARVSVRVAAGPGTIYIDAGENTILEVQPGGWQARAGAPAVFLRSQHARPLPTPKKRGSLTGFRRLLQIEADAAWVGIRGWLLGALCPTGPVPPLFLEGDDSRRLARLARQLASVLDPRSPVPLSKAQSLLFAGRGLSDGRGLSTEGLFSARGAEGANWSSPLGPPTSNQELPSAAWPFVTCLPAPRLTSEPPVWQGPTDGQSALQVNGRGPSATDLSGWGSAARPLDTRIILIGSGAALPAELRTHLLTVRPAFQGELFSAAPRDPAAPGATDVPGAAKEDPPESSACPDALARSEALGVLLAGAAEGLNHAGKPLHSEEAHKSHYAPFLAWVAAAEAGLSPTALGSGLSGPPSRPFVDVWREGRRPPGLFRRLLRALRRWVR